MQTVYFLNCLGSYRGFGIKERLLHHLDTTWIPFLIQMSQFCLYSKNRVGVQNDPPPEKLLPQVDCTTCLEMLWKVTCSSNYF